MKIKVFTNQESEELLMQFKVIAEHTLKLNNAVHDMLDLKYDTYLKKFKKTLLKRKPISFDQFVHNISCRTDLAYFRFKEIDVSNVSYLEYDFFHDLLPHKFKYFKGAVDEKYYNYTISYTSELLTTNDINLLIETSLYNLFFIENVAIHTKYLTLKKYAHTPYEMDESDVTWLETIDTLYDKID